MGCYHVDDGMLSISYYPQFYCIVDTHFEFEIRQKGKAKYDLWTLDAAPTLIRTQINSLKT